MSGKLDTVIYYSSLISILNDGQDVYVSAQMPFHAEIKTNLRVWKTNAHLDEFSICYRQYLYILP